jgi:serine protease Do
MPVWKRDPNSYRPLEVADKLFAKSMSSKFSRPGLLLSAVFVAAAFALAGCSSDEPGPREGNVAEAPPSAAPDIPEEEPVARVASQVGPSVVQVNVEAVQETPFGTQQQEGLGSGVIYRQDGYIITNAHVVAGASEVNVAFADGTTEVGEVVGADERTDIAVVRVDRDGLPAASFTEETPDVGQFAVALGSPSGFESTVTYGVVSGLNREVPPELTGGTQAASLVDLIQTDAAISPGSSGGALSDRDGEIIGINVAYLPPETGAEGIGFAIPSATATSIADQLIETGEVSRPLIGIIPIDISASDAEQFGISGVENGGAGVAEVEPGSPADEAGLEVEDIITELDGEPIESSGDLYGALRNYQPGDTIELTVVRDGNEETFEVTLGEQS